MSSQTPLVIAVDFDHTIAHNIWPELGTPLSGVQETLQKLKYDGHHIIIWTCREGDDVCCKIPTWLKEHNIPWDQINEHHPEILDFYVKDTRKILADIYIDDKNLGGLPPWDQMYDLINKHALTLVKRALDLPTK